MFWTRAAALAGLCAAASLGGCGPLVGVGGAAIIAMGRGGGGGGGGDPGPVVADPGPPAPITETRLTVGRAAGAPGTTVQVDVRAQVRPEDRISAISFDVTVPDLALTIGHVSAGGRGQGGALDGLEVIAERSRPDRLTIVVWGLQGKTLGTGLVCTIDLAIGGDADPGERTLAIGGIVPANEQGNRMAPVGALAGAVVVN